VTGLPASIGKKLSRTVIANGRVSSALAIVLKIGSLFWSRTMAQRAAFRPRFYPGLYSHPLGTELSRHTRVGTTGDPKQHDGGVGARMTLDNVESDDL